MAPLLLAVLLTQFAAADDLGGGLSDIKSGMKAFKEQHAEGEAQDPGKKFPDMSREAMKGFVEQADKYRLASLPIAIDKLKKLKENPAGDAKSLEVVKMWLNTQPGQPDFVSNLDAAIALLEKNRDTKPSFLLYPDSQEPCKQGLWMAFVVGHQNPVVVCNLFMDAGDNCQGYVIIHEVFHLFGLGDGDRKVTYPTRTTEETFKDAFYMGRLVQHLYTGNEEWCHLTHQGKVK